MCDRSTGASLSGSIGRWVFWKLLSRSSILWLQTQGWEVNYEQRDQISRVIERSDRKIWVTFKLEGIHKYCAAAQEPHLASGNTYDVSFLSYPHRHIFHFRVWVESSQGDIEHIQFKRWLERLYSELILDQNYKSCEQLSDDLYVQIAGRYPNRAVWIEVAEDGENGCLIKYDLTKPYHNVVI